MAAGWKQFDCVEDVAYFAFWGLQGARLQAQNYVIYPPGYNAWGSDIVREHKEHFKADAVITHWDIWVVDSSFAEEAYPWCPYFPVDQYPAPPRVIARAKECYWPVVYSKFALRTMREAGVECAYVPHGVDLNTFKPCDKTEARQRLGFPRDAFLIGLVGANKGYPSRKCIPEALLAFQEFHRRHNDAVLYLHMHMGTGNLGVDVESILMSLDIPDGVVKAVDPYQYMCGLPDAYMADAYNSMNVLHAASMGEGFGLPICFLPGQWVYLENGIKPIEDIVSGDRVLTHRGRYQRALVGATCRHIENEEIVELTVPGYNQTLRMTAEHPLWVLRPQARRFISVRRALMQRLNPQWVAAGDIREGDFLVVPMLSICNTMSTIDLRPYTDVPDVDGWLFSKYSNTGGIEVTYQNVADKAGVSFTTVTRILGKYGDREVGHGISAETQSKVERAAAELGWSSVKRSIPAELPLNYETGLLFGYYIAEGNVGTNGQVEFASHVCEDGHRQAIREILEDWGLNVRENAHHGQAARLYTCNKALSQVLSCLCGSGAHHKRIPLEFALFNREFARGLITGMWWGDGSLAKAGFTYSTTSRKLAHGFRRLLLGFRILCSVNVSEREGKSTEYNLAVLGKQSDSLAELIGEGKVQQGKRRGQSFIVHGEIDCAYVPVKRVARKLYTGMVYNFEVEEDNSYCVMGFAAHNCEAQACGTRVVTTDCSSMTEITFDGIATKPAQRFWTQLDSWAVMPSVDNMVEAWERLYAGELGDTRQPSQKAIEEASQYAWPIVLNDHWRPFLEALEERLIAERAIYALDADFQTLDVAERELPLDRQEVDEERIECVAGLHKWAKTGLYAGKSLCVPCLRQGCEAELRIAPNGTQEVRPTGFGMTRHGITLDIEDDPDGGVAKIAFRELGSSYRLDDIPFEDGDVVLDLGAHVGVVSIYLAKLYPGIKVFAFEPVPENYERLVRNIEANGVQDSVTAIEMAVTGDGRTLTLWGNLGENSGGASALVPGGGEEYHVPSCTLEEIFQQYIPERCKLLKMDIEGAEYEVMAASNNLLKRVDYLALEIHTNKLLDSRHQTANGLKNLCAAYVKDERLRVCMSGLGETD